MKIFPSIDLLQQQVVRLYRGDYNQRTFYSSLPQELLQEWQALGAQQVHIVDLNAARGEARQIQLLAALLQQFSSHIDVQVGGGVRSHAHLSELLKLGATRVVLGSLAAEQPQQVHELMRAYGSERITLACDVLLHEGSYRVRTRGWQKDGGLTLEELIEEFHHYATPWLITDISCDGTLEGPHFALYRSVLQRFPALKLIASGGVRHCEDLREARNQGAWGCIIGRALHEGHINLAEALTC